MKTILKTSPGLTRSEKRTRAKLRPLRVPTVGAGPWTAPLRHIPVTFLGSTSDQESCASTVQRSFNRSTSSAPAVAIANDHGFWQLTFNGQQAVVPQNQALFYLSFLLSHPFLDFVSADKLESAVYDRFQDHPDFIRMLPSVWLKGERSQVLKLLHNRERALHRLIDASNSPEVVKNEALDELLQVNGQEQQVENDGLRPSASSDFDPISKAILEFYNELALALDACGNPHPVLRPFARHLLLYVLIPSIKASRGRLLPMFAYTGGQLFSSSI
jgi:hypothetical protein